MKWIELIELRSAHHNPAVLESSLRKLIDDVENAHKEQMVKSYRRRRVDTDFSIHLFHDSKKVEDNGSQLGLRLAAALKAFGSVNHRIWIEI